MHKTTVVVTGGSGFVGSNLIHILKTKGTYNIRLMDRSQHSLFRPRTLEKLLENVNVVVHLAGANRGTNTELLKVNAEGTLGLLEGLAAQGSPVKIVFASSVLVYSPTSLYGLSKRIAEQLIERYARIYPIKGTILRLSNVYGPGGRPFYNSVVATFANLIRAQAELTVKGDGLQTRDFVFVKDVVEAFARAIEYEPAKVDVFDICSGKETSLKSVVQTLEKIVGRPIPVRYDEGQDSFPRVHLDCSRARTALAWQPKTSLEEGLRLVMGAF
ncbi:MAG: NAD(P)-dependent oxidoreductase [Nitrososphaerota archaeon]|nr:NAD(P)-dependent oxidoreductase [Nitrososphaerota archaeon]